MKNPITLIGFTAWPCFQWSPSLRFQQWNWSLSFQFRFDKIQIIPGHAKRPRLKLSPPLSLMFSLVYFPRNVNCISLKFSKCRTLDFFDSISLDMIINYHFHFQHEEEIYNVFFYARDYRDGSAHSSNYALRRSWARRLPRSQNWAPLECSDYLQFLHENDLFYTQYCVFKYENTITVFIKWFLFMHSFRCLLFRKWNPKIWLMYIASRWCQIKMQHLWKCSFPTPRSQYCPMIHLNGWLECWLLNPLQAGWWVMEIWLMTMWV